MADGIVNLGSEKLNIDTTTAKGLEKAIGVIAKFIISTQGKANGLLYGNFALGESDANAIKRALDRGLVNVLDEIARVDICNIINYSLNEISGGISFDPKEAPPTSDPIARKKWNLQNTSFKVQTLIDGYYNSYGTSNNNQSKAELYRLIQSINQELSNSVFLTRSGINDPELLKAFPQLSTTSSFFQDTLSFFNRYTDFRQIPNSELQKIVRSIDNIRFYCILIQGLNTPASLINFTNTVSNQALQDQIANISKIVDPARLIPLLRAILNTANNINSVGRTLLGYINTLNSLIRIAVLIVKAFNIVKAFFIALPIPSMFITVGIQNKFTEIYQDVIKEQGQKKLIKRLSQINTVLDLMNILVSSIVIGMQEVINRLNTITLGLEACNNIDQSIVGDMKTVSSSLTDTVKQLNDFSRKYNENKNNSEKEFGGYQIEIVTEQIVDENISIRRRFGIARDYRGYIVVQSTPTFASLDLIIINEVKTLLVSKGLVKPEISILSSEDTVIIQESLRYLGDVDLSLNNTQLSDIDVSSITDQDESLGLGTFINNLPGGKVLRKKVRKSMQESIARLGSDLKETNPPR
jgi:hypothetical protein